MNADANIEQIRLRCINTVLNLDDESLLIIDALFRRAAVTAPPAERKPRAKQTKRAIATPASTTEVER